jgi:hypothetical protein
LLVTAVIAVAVQGVLAVVGEVPQILRELEAVAVQVMEEQNL